MQSVIYKMLAMYSERYTPLLKSFSCFGNKTFLGAQNSARSQWEVYESKAFKDETLTF